jgi:hypothetical protein
VPPTQRRPELGLPPSIDQIVLGAMAKEPSQRPATMDQFSEMLSALLASLPPDPNRPASAALSAQRSAVGAAVIPPAMSAFQPPTPPPFSPTSPPPSAPTSPPPSAAPSFAPAGPAPSVPPSGFTPAAPALSFPPSYPPPPDHVPPPAAAISGAPVVAGKSRAPLYVVLGVLALGAAGVGVWVATRDRGGGGSGSGSAERPDEPTDPSEVRDPDQPDVPDTPEDPDDPWADKGNTGEPTRKRSAVATRPAPPAKSVGTDETPIPKGAYISPPSGFQKFHIDGKSQAYVDPSRGLLVAMAPLFPGTNDPDELAAMWTKATGAQLLKRDKGQSAGRARDAMIFSATVENVQVAQVIVLYISDQYRLGVLYQLPAVLAADQAAQREIDSFFLHNVHLP